MTATGWPVFRRPIDVTGHGYGPLVATVLLTDSAVTNLRNWLESDDGRAWQRRTNVSLASRAGRRTGTSAETVVDLVVSATREVAGRFDAIPAERPGSQWKLAAATTDEQAGITVHLRIGDAGDVDLLVDRALVVLGIRLEIADPKERFGP